jgi:pSer/pThr/pTyr-binding forkhead associated (FHA) protein
VNRKLIVNDGRRERELLLIGTMVVGRDPTCDISDADPLLSRRHVEFIARAADVIVRDLGSRNGILVNGVKIAQGILRGGDVVQVGHLQVKFVEDNAPLVVPRATDDTSMAPPPPARPAVSKAPSPMEDPTLGPPSGGMESPTQRVHRPAAVANHDTGEGFDKTIPTPRPPEADAATQASRPSVDSEKTTFAPPSVVIPAAAPAPAFVARQPAAAAPVASPAFRAKPRNAARPWTSLVQMHVWLLGVVVLLAATLPLMVGTSLAVTLAIPVIVMFVAAWFTARVISRETMKSLTALREDIELAVSGKLDEVGDPLGAAPVKDLAGVVNGLIGRVRAASAREI